MERLLPENCSVELWTASLSVCLSGCVSLLLYIKSCFSCYFYVRPVVVSSVGPGPGYVQSLIEWWIIHVRSTFIVSQYHSKRFFSGSIRECSDPEGMTLGKTNPDKLAGISVVRRRKGTITGNSYQLVPPISSTEKSVHKYHNKCFCKCAFLFQGTR